LGQQILNTRSDCRRCLLFLFAMSLSLGLFCRYRSTRYPLYPTEVRKNVLDVDVQRPRGSQVVMTKDETARKYFEHREGF